MRRLETSLTTKTILVVLICLSFSSSSGADFAGTFAEYRSQVRSLLGLAITNTLFASDSVLNQLIRQSVIAVNPIIKGKTQSYKVAVVASQDIYTLDTSIVAVHTVDMVKGTLQKQLKFVSRETFWQMKVDTGKGKRDPRPEYYDWDNGFLYLWPIQVQGNFDTIRVTATKRIPSIAAADSLNIIPQQYRPAIVQYATWLVARARQHPLADTFKRDAMDAIQMVNVAMNQRKAPSDSIPAIK